MDWHRLFGLFLIEFFKDSPFDVETEIDLAEHQQFLDLVVLKARAGEIQRELPDGLQGLGRFNLISYKSHHEAFDDWTAHELIGHFVNYRKHERDPEGRLWPAEDFRLYGISTRYPRKLFDQLNERGTPPRQCSPGVYDVPWGTADIRLLVIGELPDTDGNALLQFFSDREERVKSAQQRYKMKSTRMSTLVLKLLGVYELEGKTVPYTMEDFDREFKQEFLGKLTPQERVAGLPAEERLRGLPAEERLRGLPVAERLKGLSPEEITELRESLNRQPG